jgi:hypothetical protein
VRVDPSSDPGRDEYGLPPVDVQIPDDARDLDRDVQAYHRELKALRRRTRVRRLTRPITRRGMLVPLVAGSLALTLLSGTLLSVLAGHHVTPASQSAPGHVAASSSATPRPNASASPTNQPLPDAAVTVDGKNVPLRSLLPAVLAWVPAGCACAVALRELAKQAAGAHVDLYLVGTDRAVAQLPALAVQTGQPNSRLVDDGSDALAVYNPLGLTAILADRDGTVGQVFRNLPAGEQQVAAKLPALTGSPGATIQPVPQAT